MAPESDPPVVQIGDFLFDRSTGEVRGPAGSGEIRLAPQPAKLLELLIEKDGELATREEIRSRLWPETHVDFDQSLHFCVRQIRAAFGDSASEPTYVETLPRRGYRLARPVTASAAGRSAQPSVAAEAGRASRELGPWAIAASLAAAAIVTVALVSRPAPPAAPAARLAIMPFELAAEGAHGEELGWISEWLVAELAGGVGGIEVVGPRSTGPYSEFPFPDLARMSEELEVDHVLNARLTERDGDSRLIIELIRLSDRAHPWAEVWDDVSDWQAIASETRDEVLATLRAST